MSKLDWGRFALVIEGVNCERKHALEYELLLFLSGSIHSLHILKLGQATFTLQLVQVLGATSMAVPYHLDTFCHPSITLDTQQGSIIGGTSEITLCQRVSSLKDG